MMICVQRCFHATRLKTTELSPHIQLKENFKIKMIWLSGKALKIKPSFLKKSQLLVLQKLSQISLSTGFNEYNCTCMRLRATGSTHFLRPIHTGAIWQCSKFFIFQKQIHRSTIEHVCIDMKSR